MISERRRILTKISKIIILLIASIALLLVFSLIVVLFYYNQQFEQTNQPLVINEPLPSVSQAEMDSFNIESFSNRIDLKEKLDQIFPFGTPIKQIDAVLVNKVGAFRSDNLTGNDEEKIYRRGSSTGNNYIYYYKPVSLSGEHGWEETSSGWVIKIIHGNFPRKSDTKRDIQFGGGSGEGLKEIVVLAVPDESADSIFSEQITLAKEVLQYKIDMIPVDTFDEVEWAKLVTEHQSSPCMKTLTYECLIQQVVKLLDVSNAPVKTSYLMALSDMVIAHGDVNTAKTLLSVWPEADKIREYEREYEERISRFTRQGTVEIENTIKWFHTQYIRLLFLAGEYKKAERLLKKINDEQKVGKDYGVIDVLVKKGDLSQASKIVMLTLEWKRERPDPHINSSAHMHCNNYTKPKTRPAAMGDLALAYIKKGQLDNAYDIAQLVKHYWENNAFGQSSFCYTGFAQSSYLLAMKGLFESYSENGDKDKAHSIFQELQATQQQNTKAVRRYTKGAFQMLAIIAAKGGVTDSLEEMARFVEGHDEMDYPVGSSSYTNDPTAMIYALAGNHQKAIDRIENHNYSEDKRPSSPLMKKIGMDKTAPQNEIKLTTYLKIANTLADIGDKEDALLFLYKATPYFSTRKPKYDPAVKNLSDYITKANILIDLGEREKSREVLDELLDLYNKTTQKDYRGGQITAGFFGSFATLYARHENIEIVQKWADKLPTFYSGFGYSRIAKMLINEKRWDELDIYFEEMARVFSTDKTPISNWEHFSDALIDASDFERYMRFLDMLSDGAEEDKKRQPVRYGTYATSKKPVTPDTDKQIWMMGQLIASKLVNDNVPSEVLEQVWPRYTTNCRAWDHALPRYGRERNKKPNAIETMAACYIGMIKEKDYYESKNNSL